MTGAGLPHSEIFGSKRACRSPKLIAACCVLHRQITPRHPSMAVTGFMQTLNILGVYFTLLPIRLSKNEIVFVVVSHHPTWTNRPICPIYLEYMVGPDGLEPSTPRLSSACSNQLSYEPVVGKCVSRRRLVEPVGFEPATPCLQSRCSAN